MLPNKWPQPVIWSNIKNYVSDALWHQQHWWQHGTDTACLTHCGLVMHSEWTRGCFTNVSWALQKIPWNLCIALIKLLGRISMWNLNKANLRDLIAATGLVILLKFHPIHRFFNLCDLEICCMTLKNNMAPLLYYIKLCVSFQIHRWNQISVTVRKLSIRVKIGDFLSCVTLKFDGWPWKTIGHLFYTTSSFVHHFTPIGDFKFQLQSGNAQFGSKSTIFSAVWPWNLMDDLQKP